MIRKKDHWDTHVSFRDAKVLPLRSELFRFWGNRKRAINKSKIKKNRKKVSVKKNEHVQKKMNECKKEKEKTEERLKKYKIRERRGKRE